MMMMMIMMMVVMMRASYWLQRVKAATAMPGRHW